MQASCGRALLLLPPLPPSPPCLPSPTRPTTTSKTLNPPKSPSNASCIQPKIPWIPNFGPKQCHFIQEAQVLALRRITVLVPCSSRHQSVSSWRGSNQKLLLLLTSFRLLPLTTRSRRAPTCQNPPPASWPDHKLALITFHQSASTFGLKLASLSLSELI